MRALKLRHSIHALPLLVLVGCLLFASGCHKPSPPAEPKHVEPFQIQKPKPASFIICIDNSRSITGQEQILIRETTMLLADLAEAGDRISVVTFGKDASVAALAQINTDDDRIAFKNKVQQRVDFSENFSDIRKGLQLLAQSPQSPLLQEGYVHHVIVLSDGKLEPADRRTRAAFDEILEIRKKVLSQTDVYAVVLGNKYCNDIILKDVEGGKLDGKTLMKRFIATSENHFFHAQDMNHLLGIAVDILTQTKGTSAIGDQADADQFKIDDSVQTVTLIVRKRSTDGTKLCDSADILLKQPSARKDSQQSIYRNTSYQYFDLIVVREPDEGIWSVTLANGRRPEVLSKIVTPIELRYSCRPKYYLNETALVRAWVFDQKNSKIVPDRRYQLKARLAQAGNLESSNKYLSLHLDSKTGQHFLEVPGEVFAGMDLNRRPVKLEMEVIAERSKEGSTEMDPWFLRRTPAISLEIVEPFIGWFLPGERLIKLPFVKKDLIFGGSLKSSHPQKPDFEIPPRLEVEIERFDEKSQAFASLIKSSLDPKAGKEGIIYQEIRPLKSLNQGTYRFQYHLKGVVRLTGPFDIRSPAYLFEVQSFSSDSWRFWAAVALICFAAFCLIRRITARMQGTLTTDGKKVILNGKTYQGTPGSENLFTLKAKKRCLLRSGIILTVTRGKVVVDGNHLLTQGQKVRLNSGMPHTIFHDEAGKRIETRIMANV